MNPLIEFSIFVIDKQRQLYTICTVKNEQVFYCELTSFRIELNIFTYNRFTIHARIDFNEF